MPKRRGKEHTTLTETAKFVVRELKKLGGIKMIAPGQIKTNSRKGPGKRFITAVYTNAGMELLVSGQSIQKIAIHTEGSASEIFNKLRFRKTLKNFEFKERERKPEI